jgi:hypothetical protein
MAHNHHNNKKRALSLPNEGDSSHSNNNNNKISLDDTGSQNPKLILHNTMQSLGTTFEKEFFGNMNGFECRIKNEKLFGTIKMTARKKVEAFEKCAAVACDILAEKGLLVSLKTSTGSTIRAPAAQNTKEENNAALSQLMTDKSLAHHPFCVPFSMPFMNGAFPAKKLSNRLLGDGKVSLVELKSQQATFLIKALSTSLGERAYSTPDIHMILP